MFHALTISTIPGVFTNSADGAIFPLDESGAFSGTTYAQASVTAQLNTVNNTIVGSFSHSLGSGSFSLSRVIASSTPIIKTQGDFNLDGKADILWRNNSTGLVWLYTMSSGSVIGSQQLFLINPQWEIAATNDFNGDGHTDILWKNSVTGMVWMYLMNKTLIMSSARVSQISDLNWEISKTGDLNGDKKADIIWRHKLTGSNWLYLMDGASISISQALNSVSTSWQIVSD